MKKFWAILLSIAFIMPLWCPNYAFADELNLESTSAILMEASTGKVIYNVNVDEKRAPASVTKLMTLIIALEAIENGRGHLEDTVVTSAHAASLGGSQIYLEVGEQMTLHDMLIAIAVGSANDACVAVAEHLYGSEEGFVEAMNQKATSLGMVNTHFVNPYGLPDANHYTSAGDLALLAREGLAIEGLLDLTSIKHYTLRADSKKPFELYNTNKLLWWYPGADGLKTGWVGPESGYCLASTAAKDNLRFITVVLGAQEQHGNFRDSMKLLNYGFANYKYIGFYQANELIDTIEIAKGQQDTLQVGTNQIIGITLEKSNSAELTTRYQLNDKLCAPIQQGAAVGEIQIVKDNEILSSFELVALETVEKASFWQQLVKVFKMILSCF